jgi:molybdopterin synthase catalytic subunit
VFRIVEGPLPTEEILLSVSHPEAGAVASFLGTVREENVGKRVLAVEYHAYPAMAERILGQIGEEVTRAYGPVKIAIFHRVGRLRVGEVSVVIAVGAAHRHEALGAVAYAIERVKQAVPIWKKEHYRDGSVWLEPAPALQRGPIKK